jgi:hypothetical protein
MSEAGGRRAEKENGFRQRHINSKPAVAFVGGPVAPNALHSGHPSIITPAIKYANPCSGEGGHPAPPVGEMLNLAYLIAGVIIW